MFFLQLAEARFSQVLQSLSGPLHLCQYLTSHLLCALPLCSQACKLWEMDRRQQVLACSNQMGELIYRQPLSPTGKQFQIHCLDFIFVFDCNPFLLAFKREQLYLGETASIALVVGESLDLHSFHAISMETCFALLAPDLILAWIGVTEFHLGVCGECRQGRFDDLVLADCAGSQCLCAPF